MAFRIHKILNNNAVVVLDEGREKIVMGGGIAFQKKRNDIIAMNKIEKIFVMNESEQFQQLLSSTPEEHVAIAEAIISHAEGVFRAPLNDYIHVALTDHLSFALQRLAEGYRLQNKLLSEIKVLYRTEYEIGLWGKALIAERLNIEIPEDEVAHIALHIHTAKQDAVSLNRTLRQTTMIQEMMEIVARELAVVIDHDSMNYHRLLTHLRFALNRMEHNEPFHQIDEEMLTFIQQKLEREYATARLMNEWLELKYEKSFPEEEMAYISLHLNRLANRTK